jgi:copper oxidase (laccase) domain-containing protein
MRRIEFSPRLSLWVSEAKDGTMKSADQHPGAPAGRAPFLLAIGAAPDRTARVHVSYDRSDYCRYQTVTAADGGAGITRPVAVADGLATRIPGLWLFLPLADCMGTVLWDPVTEVLMLTHLGRHSVVQDGGRHSVEYLEHEFGVEARNLHAWLGPSPSGDAYPIHDRGDRAFPDVVTEQLATAGLDAAHIVPSGIETDRDPDFFSHSEYLAGRQVTDGRHAMCVRIDESAGPQLA